MRRRRAWKVPLAVPLTLELAAHDHALYRLFAEDPRYTQRKARILFAAFAFKADERQFARAALLGRPELHLFRSNQRRFCGDFILVDASYRAPTYRRALAVELKRNKPLKVDCGAGQQLKNAERAVAAIARETGLLPPDAPVERLCGDSGLLLERLGVASPEPTLVLSESAALCAVS